MTSSRCQSYKNESRVDSIGMGKDDNLSHCDILKTTEDILAKLSIYINIQELLMF